MKKPFRKIRRSLLLILLLWLIIRFIDIALLSPWHSLASNENASFFTYAGVTHVHSRHSDGSGYLPAIHQAARENELDFLLLSDHNVLTLQDSTSELQRPQVLVGAELSLGHGHLLSYGLSSLPPNFSEARLGGYQAILDSLQAQKGFAIIAHPRHPKIRWKADSIDAGLDGMEILNADVEWRNDRPDDLLAAFIAYPFFSHAMNLLLDTPEHELAQWDALTIKRHFVGIGSADAHANIKLGSGRSWAFPSYKKTFSLVQNIVYLRNALSNQSAVAKQQIVQAVRKGNLHFGYAALGDLHAIRIWSASADSVLLPGERASLSAQHAIKVVLPAVGETETHLYRNSQMIASSHDKSITWEIDSPGVYRVAIFQLRKQFPYFVQRAMPWAFSNPFYYSEQAADYQMIE